MSSGEYTTELPGTQTKKQIFFTFFRKNGFFERVPPGRTAFPGPFYSNRISVKRSGWWKFSLGSGCHESQHG